jgi:hypothetical protein
MAASKVQAKLRQIRRTLVSKTGIRILKGVLAYHIVMILFFLPGFRRLTRFPVVLNGMFLISIAGFPGKTVGEVIAGGVFALTGALIGAVVFVVEAKLVNAPVAQGFILALFLYCMAYIKAGGIQFFGFALL